jgi:hypothetical protein
VQGWIFIEDPSTEEVPPKFIGIIFHKLIQPRSHVHLKKPRKAHKYPQLDIQEEVMNKTLCMDSFGRLTYQLLIVKKKGEDVKAWLLGIRKYF